MAGERDSGAEFPQPRSELEHTSDQPGFEPRAEVEAEQTREQSRQMLRQLRGQIRGGTSVLRASNLAVPSAPRPNVTASPAPEPVASPVPQVGPVNNYEPAAFFDELFTQNVLKQVQQTEAMPASQVGPEQNTHQTRPYQPSAPAFSRHLPAIKPSVQTSTDTFHPAIARTQTKAARLEPIQRAKPGYKERSNTRRWLDIVGLLLEGAVILAIVLWLGYAYLGWFQPALPVTSNLSSGNPAALWNNGAVINVDAGNTFLNLPDAPTLSAPTLTPPVPTATPTAQTNLDATPTFVATVETVVPTVAAASATPELALPLTTVAVPTVRVKPTLAATPTLKPVAPGSADYSQSPPTRLVIPRLGLDTSVKDVTVKLGSWQVADYAAGHNLGTANPGEVGNMVLAGHRDIRGSVFLRLPDLQKGDNFTVYSNAGAFRYVVTEIFEVAPTDISVMNPTSEASATLITCTPLGTSTRRLIVRARLIN